MELPLFRDGYTCNRGRKDNVLPEIYDKGAYAVVGGSWSAATTDVVTEGTAVFVSWYFAGKSWIAVIAAVKVDVVAGKTVDYAEVSACWCRAAGT